MTIINLTTPMSDDKERQQRNKDVLDAIERYTDERMAVDYVCEPADGSRSGGQPAQGYGVVTAANYTSPIGGAGVVTHGVVGVATQSDALLDAEGVKLYWYRQGKDDGVEHERAKIVAWLRDGFVRDWGQLWRNQLINAIEAGEHLKEQSK